MVQVYQVWFKYTKYGSSVPSMVQVYQVWSKCVRSKKSEEEKDGRETGGGKEKEKEEPGEEEGSGFSAQFSTILVCWQMTSQIGASVRTQGGDEMPEPFATFGRVVGVCRKHKAQVSFSTNVQSFAVFVQNFTRPPTFSVGADHVGPCKYPTCRLRRGALRLPRQGLVGDDRVVRIHGHADRDLRRVQDAAEGRATGGDDGTRSVVVGRPSGAVDG